MKNYHLFTADIQYIDVDGSVFAEEKHLKNILHDQGEQAILSAYFDTDLSGYGATPSYVYFGLDNRSSSALLEADTSTNFVNEPSTSGGYERIPIGTATGFTLAQPGAFYRAESPTTSWTAAGGSIGPVQVLWISTSSHAGGTSGKLIASIMLTTSRTLSAGQAMNISMTLGLSE